MTKYKSNSMKVKRAVKGPYKKTDVAWWSKQGETLMGSAINKPSKIKWVKL